MKCYVRVCQCNVFLLPRDTLYCLKFDFIQFGAGLDMPISSSQWLPEVAVVRHIVGLFQVAVIPGDNVLSKNDLVIVRHRDNFVLLVKKQLRFRYIRAAVYIFLFQLPLSPWSFQLFPMCHGGKMTSFTSCLYKMASVKKRDKYLVLLVFFSFFFMNISED